MKKLILFLFTIAAFQSAEAQTPFKSESIPLLIAKTSTDSVACLERMTAYYFHIIINNYRKEKRLEPLNWNDTLWIAAKNHSLWMSNQDDLTHSETANTPYFTGSGVGDRVLYASSGNKNLRWGAENAMYSSYVKGKDISAMALDFAKDAFEQWKGSSGHNQNMLKKNCRSHGVAFIIVPGTIWATDVFTFNGSENLTIEFPTSSIFKLKKLKVD